ncbi:MAG: solute carrier family 13 (sodium-dependent dicarboxylate transporter) member 2/3/5 [Gammaproteobacteria bacterium]|nr:MAG: solute carrier family 13 (sodium-dependent dicarboxylate transporter) member 2/3/5 [Gammaproteobacteria bacterium]
MLRCGFAMANGFAASGLPQLIAGQLDVLQGVSPTYVIFAIVLLVILLTEVTSDTATATLMLLVTGALALAM